ncbi:MAG: FtsW/RodA/SpoVE family cell cycle protein [Ruminococcaceae bacterium]|nr:FtsW/RodA/SpoVE family cell cycle protein [Oscillospiraceae bacterium]
MIPSVYSDVLTAILRYAVPGLSIWLFARCAARKGKTATKLLLLTLLQALLTLSYYLKDPGNLPLGFAGIAACQWLLLLNYKLTNKNAFETEILCFFLSTFGMCAILSVCPEEWGKQLASLLLGVLFFLFLGWILSDGKRIRIFRPVAAVTGGLLLLVTLFFGETYYGAKCWLYVGGVSFQPAELTKICFLFAGTPQKEKESIVPFFLYAVTVCLILGLMNDFGTALIFSFAFLVIAFLRFGFGALLFGVAGVALAGVGILRFAPHAFSRFDTWRHIWEAPLSGGYQQTRALMCIASGGLLGLGAGKGWMQNLFAADSDMVIATVGEEWGLMTVGILLFCILAVSLRAAQKNTVYAVAAAAVLLFQTALNALGTVDILPLTGVTFPFLSNGGTSMLCAWGLLALIQGGET